MKGFAEGTVVRLASGGVRMTIAGTVTIDGRQKCCWMADNNGLFELDIPVSALVAERPRVEPIGFAHQRVR